MTALAVSIYTVAFQHGYVEGLTGVTPEGCPPHLRCPIEENDVVDIVTNLVEIALEGTLTDEQLRHDTGLLAGWISRAVYPPVNDQQQLIRGEQA